MVVTKVQPLVFSMICYLSPTTSLSSCLHSPDLNQRVLNLGFVNETKFLNFAYVYKYVFSWFKLIFSLLLVLRNLIVMCLMWFSPCFLFHAIGSTVSMFSYLEKEVISSLNIFSYSFKYFTAPLGTVTAYIFDHWRFIPRCCFLGKEGHFSLWVLSWMFPTSPSSVLQIFSSAASNQCIWQSSPLEGCFFKYLSCLN